MEGPCRAVRENAASVESKQTDGSHGSVSGAPRALPTDLSKFPYVTKDVYHMPTAQNTRAYGKIRPDPCRTAEEKGSTPKGKASERSSGH